MFDWPADMPENYLKWVNILNEHEDNKLEKIRHSIKRGNPYGSESWIKETAKKSNLISTLIPRGRPKKGT